MYDRAGRVSTVTGGMRPNCTAIIIMGTLFTILAFLVLVFGIQSFNSGPAIQGRIGPQGEKGPKGDTGLINISSVNQSFTGINLILSGDLNFTGLNSTIRLGPNGSIYWDFISQTIVIEPGISVSEIVGPDDGGPITVITNNYIVEGSVTVLNIHFTNAPPGSNISIFYNNQTNTIDFAGAPVNLTLVMPIFIGDAGYITNGPNQTLEIIGNQGLVINGTTVTFNAFLEILEAILSAVNFWNDVYISTGRTLFFGNSSTVNGSIPSISAVPNNLTINGYNYSLLLETLNQIVLQGNLIQLNGNVSLLGSLLTDLVMNGRLIFNQNGASIYASGSCLNVVAPSICINTTNPIVFNSDVIFRGDIQQNLTVNGSLTVLGDFNLAATFTFQNLTVLNTLTVNTEQVLNLVVNQSITTVPGSQTFIGGFLTTGANSVSNFNGVVKFLNTNLSSLVCSVPLFSPSSGCAPFCTNHTSCNDAFNNLGVVNSLTVNGDINQNNTVTPHPCCLSFGTRYYVYQRWSSQAGSPFTSNSSGYEDLSFTNNDTPGVITASAYIGFAGGDTWTVLSTGLYQITLSAQLNGTATNANVAFFVLCGINVFSSPNFFSIRSVVPFNGNFTLISTTTFGYTFEVVLNSGVACNFKLGHTGGNIAWATGSRFSLGLRLENPES